MAHQNKWKSWRTLQKIYYIILNKLDYNIYYSIKKWGRLLSPTTTSQLRINKRTNQTFNSHQAVIKITNNKVKKSWKQSFKILFIIKCTVYIIKTNLVHRRVLECFKYSDIIFEDPKEIVWELDKTYE